MKEWDNMDGLTEKTNLSKVSMLNTDDNRKSELKVDIDELVSIVKLIDKAICPPLKNEYMFNNDFRKDEVQLSLPIELVTLNAPSTYKRLITVPKTFESE